MQLPTVRVKDNADSFIIINASDFDPDVHKLWVEPGSTIEEAVQTLVDTGAATPGPTGTAIDQSAFHAIGDAMILAGNVVKVKGEVDACLDRDLLHRLDRAERGGLQRIGVLTAIAQRLAVLSLVAKP